MAKPDLTSLKSETLQRSITISQRNVDEDARTVELAFSSEAPVERWGYEEILVHSTSAIRLGRLENGGAVLMDHDHRDQVGVVESVRIDSDGVGRAVVRFGSGERASEIFTDIKDGIRKHVSVGYRIHDYIYVDIDGDALDQVRVTDWEPFEISIVSVPADSSVGVGRSADAPAPKSKPEKKMDDDQIVDQEALRKEAAEQERARIAGITQLGEKFGKRDLAEKLIANGTGLNEARAEFVDGFKLPATPAKREAAPSEGEAQRGMSAANLDLSTKEVERFDLMRAANAALTGDWSKAGFERECSIAIGERMNKEAQGFYLPIDVIARSMQMQAMQRTMATGAGAGFTNNGDLVATELLESQFIAALRAKSILGRTGATYLMNLQGNVDIPRQNGAAQFYWVGEDGEPTESDVPTGTLGLSPKTIAAAVPMTRRLLKQSTPSVQNMVLNDLIAGAGLAIDKGAILGGGADGPTGLVNTTGVNTVAIAAAASTGKPTWAEIVQFQTEVDADDVDLENLAYVTTAALRGGMKTTTKDSGSGQFICDGNTVDGLPCLTSSQLDTKRIIFGNWQNVMIGMWGALDILPDAAAKAASGGLVLRVFQDVDVAIRYPQAFAINA